jgi:hypothetical protein
MFYTISPSPDGKYIIVRVTVDMTRNLAKEIASQALSVGQELGIKYFLLDLTQSRNRESIFGSYESAYIDMANMRVQMRFTRTAMLVDPQDDSHNFNETVLRNVGLNVTLFRDRHLAVQHLLKD